MGDGLARGIGAGARSFHRNFELEPNFLRSAVPGSGANIFKALRRRAGGGAGTATTPNAAARNLVQGEYVDPLTNKAVRTTDYLAADHVFPKKLIQRLPGFDKLSRSQQAAVLNNLNNFQGLPTSFNASKGSKLDWSLFKGAPLDAKYARELAQLQERIRKELQQQIDDFL